MTSPRIVPRTYTNLELLRFIAAFSVVVWHYQHFGKSYLAATPYTQEGTPFFDVLKPFITHGLYGVQFFWLLSGFIFFSQYADKIRDRAVSAREFIVRRFSRLYPLHIVTALMVFAMQRLYQSYSPSGIPFIYPDNSPEALGLHAAMASFWDTRRQLSLNGPVWSVSLEIVAYAVFFLLMRYVRGALLILPVGVLLAVASSNTEVNHVNAYQQLFGYFFTGGLLWFLAGHFERIQDRTVRRILTGGLAVVLTALLIRALFIDPSLTTGLGLFSAVILLAATFPQLGSRSGRIASHLGNLTYSSYLIHFPLQLATVIGFAALGGVVPWANPLFFVAYLITTFGLAFVVFRYFERPAQQLLRGKLSKVR